MTATLDRLVTLVCTTSRLIREHTRPRERINPMSVLRLEALAYVADHPQVSMRAIAESLAIAPPSATVIVNELVRTGHLKRLHDGRDRRIVRLTMTPRGKRILSQGMRALGVRLRHVFARLDHSEQQNLIRILEKLAAKYRQ